MRIDVYFPEKGLKELNEHVESRMIPRSRFISTIVMRYLHGELVPNPNKLPLPEPVKKQDETNRS